MFTYGIVCFLLLKSTVRSLKIHTQETFFTSTEWCEFQESTTNSLILQHPWSLSCICIFWKSPNLVSFTEVHVSYSLSWTCPEPLPGPDPSHTSCGVLSAHSAHGCPRVTAEKCWVPATRSEVNGNSRCSAFLQRVAKGDGEYPDTGKKLLVEGGPEGKKICWGLPTSRFFTSPPPVKATGSLCALGGCTPEKPPVLLKNRLPWVSERLKRQRGACRESPQQAGASPALRPCAARICSCLGAPLWTASCEIFRKMLKIFQVKGISTHF